MTTLANKDIVLPFGSTSVSLRWDTPGHRAGHRAGLVSVGLLPQAGKEDEMFSGYNRRTPAGEKHLPSALTLLNLSHLIAFASLATNSPALYFHHLTHIQKLLPGECCSRNQVQAFDPAPDHWLKGCHFSFRQLSIPQQLFISKPGRHTCFFSTRHDHMTTPFSPLMSNCVRELSTIPKLMHNTGKTIWNLLCWNWTQANQNEI